jgi:hypothetical protein
MTSITKACELLSASLPRNAVWELGPDSVSVRHDFTRLDRPLMPMSEAEVCGRIPAEWSQYRVFGEERVEGGADIFLCIAANGRTIHQIDVELSQPVRLLNSGAAGFIASFSIMHALLVTKSMTLEVAAQALRNADPLCYSAGSDWRNLVDHLGG